MITHGRNMKKLVSLMKATQSIKSDDTYVFCCTNLSDMLVVPNAIGCSNRT